MRLLLLSNAKREGSAYLEWALTHFSDFFKPAAVSRIVFVPFAGVTAEPDAYVDKVRPVFAQMGIEAAAGCPRLAFAARDSPAGIERHALRGMECRCQSGLPHDHDQQRHAHLRPGRI